jgi:hypothetical protein
VKVNGVIKYGNKFWAMHKYYKLLKQIERYIDYLNVVDNDK